MTSSFYNGIHARILSHLDDRHTLEFTKTPNNEDSWSCQITYCLVDVQGDVRFVTLDDDIDYEEEQREPHTEIGSMVTDILSLRWPIPWPKMDMVAAARIVWSSRLRS
jgi:hypothetical protein